VTRAPVFLRALCAAGALGLAPHPTSAQFRPADPDSAFAATLAEIRGEDLALEEAVARALAHATALRDAEAALLAAEGALRREKGAFDPVLFGDLGVRDEDVTVSSPFAGAPVVRDGVPVVDEKEVFSAAGARLTLPLGTELEAVLQSSRLETTSEFAAVSPRYATQGRLAVRQPLLKGFGPAASGERTSAVEELQAAQARHTDATLAIEAEVTTVYWDLYAAERDLAVQRLIADRAEAFLEEASRRADAGLVGPGEVATARVFHTEQRLSELDNEERLDEVSDRLVSLIGRAPSTEAGRYHPTAEPPADVPLEEVEILIERAFAWNGELQAARSDMEAQRAAASAARWNAFPQLDVLGSIGGNGLTGTAKPIVVEGDTLTLQIDDGWGAAASQALTGDFPLWSVGVTLEVPLGAREGRGERDRLNAEVERAAQRVIELERTLREDVRARHRELRHGLRRLELAREGVEAALEQVRIGTVEYDSGRTTAFELVRLGADFATAQERYSNALVRTAKAAAELRRLAPPDVTAGSPEGER
jgi:outer membrane protein TolC